MASVTEENMTDEPIELMMPPQQEPPYQYLPRGILLSALLRMREYGVVLPDGETIMRIEPEWSTTNVAENIIKKVTKEKTMFIEIVKNRSLISPLDFDAVFVSHACAVNFTEILGILEIKFEGENDIHI